MDYKEKYKINFQMFGGPVYSGRKKGENANKKINLNNLNDEFKYIEIEIPDDTYSINSSFFLGLFGPIIKKFNSMDSFLNKYQFKCNEDFMVIIKQFVQIALLEKRN